MPASSSGAQPTDPTALLPAGFRYPLCLHGPLREPSVRFTGGTLGEADSLGHHLSLLLPGSSGTPVPPAVRDTACVIREHASSPGPFSSLLDLSPYFFMLNFFIY